MAMVMHSLITADMVLSNQSFLQSNVGPMKGVKVAAGANTGARGIGILSSSQT
jgi:hypothetical protein